MPLNVLCCTCTISQFKQREEEGELKQYREERLREGKLLPPSCCSTQLSRKEVLLWVPPPPKRDLPSLDEYQIKHALILSLSLPSLCRRNDVSASKGWGYCDKKCYSQFVDAGKLQECLSSVCSENKCKATQAFLVSSICSPPLPPRHTTS
jgi:hypothetical protein